MQINIYAIAKKDAAFQVLEEEFCMQCRQFGAEVKIFELLPPSVLKAQKISSIKAQQSYTQTFHSYIKPLALNIALHPQGKSYDSISFANLLESARLVQFFIGGAYGLEEGFVQMCRSVSLSAMTFSHKIAKLVLCEQIYRALSILNAHPYHK
ncbi:23S rRNA (pseudouridine(1915)-N(3))-methyltransferase RlmH [Helicobacter jaachi]|uniref:Ribosomal RNA large subunit methyltransferase H n=1 Tax=Helicobacter jaachi TaxID=1677920 RepID=A0A4U8TAL3_9HELI|nr:23S rRNA (pseudouridine(1915)-N(3))-methyltransferase RlmH [Helicobacter jaachi]TLD96753.1 23S rRNA (pseudouridine(1915)-N(3))-methyltransferase RlmH [Helicobacter jaachi]